jgi:hypothetical protein
VWCADVAYAQQLLLHSIQLYDFADQYRAIGSTQFYGSVAATATASIRLTNHMWWDVIFKCPSFSRGYSHSHSPGHIHKSWKW